MTAKQEMTKNEFEDIVALEFPRAIPEKFQSKLKNVGFVVESHPSDEVRDEQELKSNETLLGLYRGIPLSERGENYGVGAVMPDVITLYQIPIEEEARLTNTDVKKVIRDTIWHEVAHHFGLNEHAVGIREKQRRKTS